MVELCNEILDVQLAIASQLETSLELSFKSYPIVAKCRRMARIFLGFY